MKRAKVLILKVEKKTENQSTHDGDRKSQGVQP